MISYHPASLGQPPGSHYSHGFKIAETDDLARIARGIVRYAWSGIAFKDGKRCKENFLYSDYCVLDIDDELFTYSLAQARKDYCDTVHIIGTTRNHQKEKNGVVCDRFRIVIPWERRITERAVYDGNMHAQKRLNDAVDGSAMSAGQHFFPCAEIVSINHDGFKQDVQDVRWTEPQLSDEEYMHDLYEKKLDFRLRGKLPPWLERFLVTGAAAPGDRHRRTLGAAMEMVEYGLTPKEIIEKLNKIPLSRKFHEGELNGIVRHAVQHVAGRLRDGRKEETDKGSNLSGRQQDGARR